MIFFEEKWLSGVIGLLDAYCPHLGANIALGGCTITQSPLIRLGEVIGDCVKCPFHGWQFETSGKCTFIPYSGIHYSYLLMICNREW